MSTQPKDFNRGNIYLSGGMQFAANLGAAWRDKAGPILKKMKYFPLDITELDVAYNKEHGKLEIPDGNEDPLLYKANMRKHFIETDLKLIRENSDALIVYYDKSARNGAGTVSEAQYAYNLNIPIFMVCDDYATLDELHKNVSGWLIALTTKYFLSFEELYEYLDSLPYGILCKDKYGNHSKDNQYLCHLSGEVFTKQKNKFVSNVNPLLSKKSVDVMYEVYENTHDRYDFFMQYLEKQTKAHFTK